MTSDGQQMISKDIISQFSIPLSIDSHQGTHFVGEVIKFENLEIHSLRSYDFTAYFFQKEKRAIKHQYRT